MLLYTSHASPPQHYPCLLYCISPRRLQPKCFIRVVIVSCRDCCLSASHSNNIKWKAKMIDLPIQFRIYCVYFLYFRKAEERFISSQLWQGKCNRCLLDIQMNMLERLGVIIRRAECFDSFSFIMPPLAHCPLFWTKWNALKTYCFVFSALVRYMSLTN